MWSDISNLFGKTSHLNTYLHLNLCIVQGRGGKDLAVLSDTSNPSKVSPPEFYSEHYITQPYLEYLLKTVWHWREVKTINFWQLWLLIFLFQGKRWSFRSLKFFKQFWQLQDKARDDKVIMSWWDMVFVFVFWIDLCICLSILVGQVIPLHLFVPRQEMGSSWVDGLW